MLSRAKITFEMAMNCCCSCSSVIVAFRYSSAASTDSRTTGLDLVPGLSSSWKFNQSVFHNQLWELQSVKQHRPDLAMFERVLGKARSCQS